jgi:8-oxo-dGTP pyrophosphatase MutT (NUDIX family)
MLTPVRALPGDAPIASIHVVAFVDRHHVVMAWDRIERYLTTIGGRVEGTESLTQALDREAIEEAGLVLEDRRDPIAAYRWPDTGTYTVFVVARVRRLVEIPPGFEKTGRVVCSLATAADIIRTVEPDPEVRLRVLELAGSAAQVLFAGAPDGVAVGDTS